MKRLIVSFIFTVLFFSSASVVIAYSIRDDATGGDCYLIGNWDSETKTCTLTGDLYEAIQIDSDYITLDGNGHTITGTTGIGILLYMRTAVTVKNINVRNFGYG